MKKYDIINSSNQAISNGLNYGPNFGNGEIKFEKNLREGSSQALENHTTFLKGKQLELTGEIGEKEYFYTADIEVFKIF